MRRRGWWLAIAVVLVTDVMTLLGVWRNRTGEPDAVVRLTERELPIASQLDEDTGMALRFAAAWWDIPWLDPAKLEELGFDCSVPPDAEEAVLHYGKQLRRRGFLALEYEGAPWEAWLAEQQEQLARFEADFESGKLEASELAERRRSFERDRRRTSRLFAVDAHRDAAVLRSRHPHRDRTLILRAIFHVRLERERTEPDRSQGPLRIVGQISQVLVRQLHLDREARAPLAKLRGTLPLGLWLGAEPDPETIEPRYEATVKVGRRFEPWIDAVHPTE